MEEEIYRRPAGVKGEGGTDLQHYPPASVELCQANRCVLNSSVR